MRPILDMETAQIEITNACHNTCSNCTRLCGHHAKPYFMPLNEVKKAIDSMQRFPKMTGIMGGEPLLHPNFMEICKYMQKRIPKERCGLWTCLPPGKEHFREVIVETFGNIFINDHTRDDILHAPILVASEEIPLPEREKDYLIDKCWVQNTWSACINPKGAWFCEVAGALAMLLDVNDLAWPVESDWWTRSPQHYIEQMQMCKLCGAAMPLLKRYSIEGRDDISPKMLERIKETSHKVKQGKYVVYDTTQMYDDQRPTATYKDQPYRDAIAFKYGMFLMVNESSYLTPYLIKSWKKGTK